MEMAPASVTIYWLLLKDKLRDVMPRSSVCCSVPVSAYQSRTVLSPNPDTTSFESGENATELT